MTKAGAFVTYVQGRLARLLGHRAGVPSALTIRWTGRRVLSRAAVRRIAWGCQQEEQIAQQ